LGDMVRAGAVLAEIENSSQRAAVLSAEGAVAAAEAALLKAKRGIRGEQQSILEIEFTNAENNLFEAKNAAINTLNSSFIASDNIIRNTVDQLYENPRTNPRLIFLVKNFQLETDLESKRMQTEMILTDWEASLQSISSDDDIFLFIDQAEKNLNTIRTFLDDVASAVNGVAPSSNLTQLTIDSWKAGIGGARTTIGGSLASVSGVRTRLEGSNASFEVARKRLEEGMTGTREEDIQSGEAFLTQMIGSLRGAEANLGKTIIRSPIAGTVTQFDIERGDFVSSFEPVAVVSNESALEVIVFITEDERSDIDIGSPARIEGSISGIVSSIAPALDVRTRKIKVSIAITDTDTHFTSGQSVRVDVERIARGSELKDVNTIIIPVTALKVHSEDVVVFTVDESGRLVAHPVRQGSLVGRSIIIKEGLTPDMEIVIDARGIEEGEYVIISQKTY